MYNYLCSLCGIRYSMKHSVIQTEKGPWHCTFCVDERYRMAENISEDAKEKIREEYTKQFDKNLILHRLR